MPKFKFYIFFLVIPIECLSQNFEHSIKIPILGYVYSNVYYGVENNYQENIFHLNGPPSIEYSMLYTKNWYIALGYQYLKSSRNRNIPLSELPVGSLLKSQIDQFYFKGGYSNKLFKQMEIRLGILIARNGNTYNSFVCNNFPVEPSIGYVNYRRINFTPDISLIYNIDKTLFIELNTNYTSFKIKDSYCLEIFKVDKYHFLHTNIKLGYKFR